MCTLLCKPEARAWPKRVLVAASIERYKISSFWEHRHDFSLPPFEVCNAVPVNIEQKDVNPTNRKRSRLLRSTANDGQLERAKRDKALADWMTIAAECSG
eukprot:4985039-Amphidinium_carterae.1